MSNLHSTIRVLGIAGSLRARSYNRGLLLAAVELAPAGMEIHPFERLGEIPHDNADLDVPEAGPEAAAARRADARARREARPSARRMDPANLLIQSPAR